MIDRIKKDWNVAEKALDFTVKALFVFLTMLVAIIAYQGREVLTKISDHEVRLTRVESSRYSSDDARRDFQLQRGDLREFIALHIKPINDSLGRLETAVKENRDARSAP